MIQIEDNIQYIPLRQNTQEIQTNGKLAVTLIIYSLTVVNIKHKVNLSSNQYVFGTCIMNNLYLNMQTNDLVL